MVPGMDQQRKRGGFDRSYGLLIVALVLTIRGIQAQCDVAQCPIDCRGTCPGEQNTIPVPPGVRFTTIDLSATTTCREIIIESPGYPNGYPGDQVCQWRFVEATGGDASISIEVREFEGRDGHILTMEGSLDDAAPSHIFMGDATAAPTFLQAWADLLRITWDPTAAPAGSLFDRGFSLRIMFGPTADAGGACTTGVRYVLTDTGTPPLPNVAIHNPLYPVIPGVISSCYYVIESPDGTQIVFDFPGDNELTDYVHYLYVYDVSTPGEPELLRIITGDEVRFNPVRTGTNRIRVVFTTGDGFGRFFARVGYEDIPPAPCSGNGNAGDECACPVAGHAYCHSGDSDPYTAVSATDDSQLSSACIGTSPTVMYTLDYTADGSAAIFASNNYFSPFETGPVECQWDIRAPEDSQLMIRFQDFALAALDQFYLRYDEDIDQPRGILRYTSDDTVLPLESGLSFQFENEPIFVDADRITVIYKADAFTISAVNPGILFEVHLLGKGLCSQPCLNGGECIATCDCNMGFAGEFCEHTEPIDFMCVVKNHYIKPHFAYPVQFYAVAGMNAWSTESFRFDYYGPSKYVDWHDDLPAPIDVDYGRILSLPARCDKKEKTTRMGAFVCLFDGDEWVDPVQIPVIVNPVSDHITPIGRYTKTVSVGESVMLSVELPTGKEDSVRWRFNDMVKQKWNGHLSITIEDISEEDCGIYEAFIKGPGLKKYNIVTYRLIVRKCPSGMYNPANCEPCPQTCYNDGTCHDVYGTCLCPPAFGGEDCSELLTGSTVSRNTGLTCPSLGITYSGCIGVMFCLTDPGGCMCMPGWMGTNCDQACEPLKFGLKCQRDCHCMSGAQCDVATGACSNGCAPTHRGQNCQEIIGLE